MLEKWTISELLFSIGIVSIFFEEFIPI